MLLVILLIKIGYMSSGIEIELEGETYLEKTEVGDGALTGAMSWTIRISLATFGLNLTISQVIA